MQLEYYNRFAINTLDKKINALTIAQNLTRERRPKDGKRTKTQRAKNKSMLVYNNFTALISLSPYVNLCQNSERSNTYPLEPKGRSISNFFATDVT